MEVLVARNGKFSSAEPFNGDSYQVMNYVYSEKHKKERDAVRIARNIA